MNILIAGIVTVIMLLLGGARYYTQYEQEQQQRQEQEQRQEQQQRNELTAYVNALPLTDFNGKNLRVIRTEAELIYIANHCPGDMRSFSIFINKELTEDRTLQLLQENIPQTVLEPDLISDIQRRFLPRG